MEVVPVLNCPDEECVAATLGKVRGFLPPGSFVHVDIADGKFTFHKTWNKPGDWKAIPGADGFALEVHLMVEEPEREVDAWLEAGAKRIIVHYEALTDQRFRAPTIPPAEAMRYIIDACAKNGAEAFLAVDPATPIIGLKDIFARFSGAQVLAVNPGLPGQKFLPLVLEKARLLRKELPDIKIEIDGGINPETAKLSKTDGANILASATYVLESPDPAAAYGELKAI